MSLKLGKAGKSSDQSMLCPCCGALLARDAGVCECSARFVGEPLDITPIKVQRLGPAMTSVAVLLIVVAASLIATKWLAFAAVLVIWLARRAVRLAKTNPDWYGGYKTAISTLTVTIVAGAGLAGYGIAHIPKALDNYETRQIAATRARMHHIASLLEQYKLTAGLGSYPKDVQEFKKATGESLPADYWDQAVKYQSYSGAYADTSISVTGVQYTQFELRSAGPDGIVGTDDDIIMRDGIFFTNSEVKKQPVAQQLR